MIQLGFCHVDDHVEVHVGQHMGESPHSAPFSKCTCARAETDKLKMPTGIPNVGETHVSHLNKGHFHQSVLLGGVSLRGVFLDNLSFGIPRVFSSLS